MASKRRLRVRLYGEDEAHERVVGALVSRVARDEGSQIAMSWASARGGHARALGEFEVFQQAFAKGHPGLDHPDILVIARDGNCSGYVEARKAVSEVVQPEVFPVVVIACPDPHIERWLMADPVSFRKVVGVEPRIHTQKCKRDVYKQALAEAIAAGEHPPTLGGLEFADDLVNAMDLVAAGRAQASLKFFVRDLKSALAQVT